MDATLPLQGNTLFPVEAVAPAVDDPNGLVDDAGLLVEPLALDEREVVLLDGSVLEGT